MTTAAPRARSQHLPLPREQRHGVALCLSGGGYRAALFHLGATRRMNELGALSRVDTITSVSGGSIFASLVAAYAVRRPDAWSQPGGPVPDYDAEVAEPMRELAKHNLRTRTVLRRLWPPRNWRNTQVQIDALAERLADGPTGRARLGELPERPRFVFCSSEMRFRAQWTFDSGARRLGSDPPGHAAFGDQWTIARAAASSSCLPGAFAPMRVTDALTGGTYEGEDAETLKRALALSDGGMYDNLGVEPVWKDHATVLASDAGPSFDPDPGLGRVWNSLRFAIILLEQATDVRKRWLLSNLAAGELEGTYWSVARSVDGYPERPPAPAYSDRFVRRYIAPIRIDLDVFSDGERAVLENHGYLMADAALRSHVRELAAGWPEPSVPFPEWMDEERAASALRDSGKTRLFARGWFRR